MDPEKVSAQFEQEVSEISMEIEERRNKLEKEAGIESHEQVAREVIAEAIHTAAAKGVQSTNSAPKGTSYLDTTDTDTSHAVNQLIDRIQEKGLTAAVAEARTESPYILDAFHDALVEKLYNSLKTANYI
jgi:hypothetical protein